jgi:hypothetical protein
MGRGALALMFVAATGIFGCSVVSSDTSSGNAANALTIQVKAQPPEDKVEDKTAPPGFGYIWVAGYWDYLDGNYVWRPGRWVAGKPDYEYVRARYEFSGGTWVFHRPHWKRRHAAPPPTGAPPPAAAPPTTAPPA